LSEIARIREKTPADLEIEAFIHGAMCISYSGRCLLSAWFTGRDANRGACTHPCRWKYAVAEESRPGEYFPIEENERGTYIFNSRDLCMIEHLPELAGAGIDSLKIEGRMKTALYVASITRAYRRAIDDYLESDEKYAAGMDWYRQEIRKCTYRDFTTGFYFGRPDTQSMVYTDNTYASDAVFLGIVEKAAEPGSANGQGSMPDRFKAGPGACGGQGDLPGIVTIHQKNKFSVGETIEIMCPDGRDLQTRVLGMWNAEWEPVQSAPHPGELIRLQLDEQAAPGDILRVSR
jgi:putative protease